MYHISTIDAISFDFVILSNPLKSRSLLAVYKPMVGFCACDVTDLKVPFGKLEKARMRAHHLATLRA